MIPLLTNWLQPLFIAVGVDAFATPVDAIRTQAVAPIAAANRFRTRRAGRDSLIVVPSETIVENIAAASWTDAAAMTRGQDQRNRLANWPMIPLLSMSAICRMCRWTAS
jgi:hypothetical protein